MTQPSKRADSGLRFYTAPKSATKVRKQHWKRRSVVRLMLALHFQSSSMWMTTTRWTCWKTRWCVRTHHVPSCSFHVSKNSLSRDCGL